MNFTMFKFPQNTISKFNYFIKRSCHCSSGTVSLSQRFKCHGIVPEVLDKAPCERLSVNYERVDVDLGNELLPIDCKNQPRVKWCTLSDKLYTLIMIDPDAPCRVLPSSRNWLHWLVGNIPCGSIEHGKTIAAYIGPAPPKKTGHHRYIFLVYQQCGKMKFAENILTNTSAKGRSNFDLTCFVQKYNLGQVKAGNFCKAEFDCYVETIHRQLGII